MKNSNWTKLIVAAIMMSLPLSSRAQLLKGIIKTDSIESMQIAYSHDGNLMNMRYIEIQPAQDGSFSWDAELPEQTSDIGIYVDNFIFGANVEKGKTINVQLTQNKKTKLYDIKFEGENASVSKFYNAYSQAFDIMKYFSPDPEEGKTIEEYRT